MSMAGQATDHYEVLRERRAEVPARFSLQGPVCVQTADLDPVSIFRSLVKPSRIPLFRLHVFNRSYRPVQPILVHLSQEDEWFFAENETLAIAGTGTSAEAAILDLEQHIVHFWNTYRQLPDDKVTGDAARLKKLFADLLTEE
jgi:hypothetical protein